MKVHHTGRRIGWKRTYIETGDVAEHSLHSSESEEKEEN
jgi:hypothetical protein